jgi:hypothetical protein
MLTLHLSSAPNPDLNQTESPAPTVMYPVHNLEEASALCRQYIETYQLGGGNWTGGQVYQAGQETHHVSFNGKVWESEQE